MSNNIDDISKKKKYINYKIYLFKKDGKDGKKSININKLELEEIIKIHYPSIYLSELTPNKTIFLFTSLYDSNRDLTKAIIDIYKLRFPNSNIDKEGYEFTTIVEGGRNAEAMGFLRYSFAKSTSKYGVEKLIPIIYDSDFIHSTNDELSNKANILQPRKLLMNIFDKSMTIENQKGNPLYTEIYGILFLKYNDRYKHVNPETDKTIDKKEDLKSIYNILKSHVMTKAYKEDSSMYLNLLAKIMFFNRISYVYQIQGKYYDPESSILTQKALLNFGISSITDRVDELDMSYYLNKEVRQKEIDYSADEDLLRKLNQYNQDTSSNYTIEDLLYSKELFDIVVDYNSNTRS